MNPVVNKLLDFVDRVGWTTAVAVIAATITVLSSDGISWQEGVKFVVLAALGTILKVLVGQNTGTDDTGSLIGTSVIEPSPQAEPTP